MQIQTGNEEAVGRWIECTDIVGRQCNLSVATTEVSGFMQLLTTSCFFEQRIFSQFGHNFLTRVSCVCLCALQPPYNMWCTCSGCKYVYWQKCTSMYEAVAFVGDGVMD